MVPTLLLRSASRMIFSLERLTSSVLSSSASFFCERAADAMKYRLTVSRNASGNSSVLRPRKAKNWKET